MTEKFCSKCQTSKPLSDYYKSSNHVDGYRTWCKPCTLEANRRNAEKNRDKKNARQRERYQQDKGRVKERQKRYREEDGRGTILKRMYDLDVTEYDAMLEAQDGRCAVCCKTPEESSQHFKRLSVDHCHFTGRVRGLLCHRCNTALGLLNDDVAAIENLVKYLEER